MSFFDRFKNAFNAFKGNERDPTNLGYDGFVGNFYRPDRKRYSIKNIRTIIATMYNKIAVDCSMTTMCHCRVDTENNDRFLKVIHSNLNYALTKSANIDQTGREMIREAIKIMLDSGSVAIVPTSTSADPRQTDSYDVYELRAGKIVEWFPRDVKVSLYNEEKGKTEEVVLSKSYVAIIENPFYDIMNESNSTVERLKRTLNQLDQYNANSTADKLDMIIQFPYMIKTESRRKQAEQRRQDIEDQLRGSKHGIAYTDGTERIIQLNRSLENNLWTQIKDLEEQLYNQLGFSKAVFDGSADENAMLNYTNQTLEPILTALSEEMERKWISRTAQTQGQAILFFSEPFRFVPVSQLAELADKLTRNEIVTSNEVRGFIGMKPVDNPRADELRNSNLNHPDENGKEVVVEEETENDVEIQNKNKEVVEQ